MTRFQLLVHEWKDCQRCHLAATRRNVVFLRGSIPCDVLFIGEAPGRSENVLGRPFIGPAGQLLDAIIDRAGLNDGGVRYAMTNLVGCIPLDDDGGKAGEPDKVSINACRGRTVGLYEMCKPKLVVCVGTLAAKWLDKLIPHRDVLSIQIDHPAFMLRTPLVQRSLVEQRAEVRLRNAVASLRGELPAVVSAGRPEPRRQPSVCSQCGGTRRITRVCDDGDGHKDTFEDDCPCCVVPF